MKKLWEYIKSNNLQNPANRQEILCDDRLRALFGCDKVKMFGMNKVGPCKVTLIIDSLKSYVV